MQPGFILNRRLKMRRPGDAATRDLWVRFSWPRSIGVRAPEGDIDTQVDLLIEGDTVGTSDNATGGDEISAMLAALVVARGHLRAIAANGYEIWWLEPGDLDDDAFWGFQIHV